MIKYHTLADALSDYTKLPFHVNRNTQSPNPTNTRKTLLGFSFWYKLLKYCFCKASGAVLVGATGIFEIIHLQEITGKLQEYLGLYL